MIVLLVFAYFVMSFSDYIEIVNKSVRHNENHNIILIQIYNISSDFWEYKHFSQFFGVKNKPVFLYICRVQYSLIFYTVLFTRISM